MRFGKCKGCKKYKYLKNKIKCKSCVNTNDDWVVLMVRGFSRNVKIYREGLTKKEANRIASRSSLYTAKPASKVKN